MRHTKQRNAVAMAGRVLDMVSGEAEELGGELARLAARGLELKAAIAPLEAELKELTAAIQAAVEGGHKLELDGVGTVTLTNRQTVDINDPDRLRGVLGARFGDLVRETVKLTAEKRLLEMLAGDPLAPALGECMTVATGVSVTWKPEKSRGQG